jgi:hypothetical protein
MSASEARGERIACVVAVAILLMVPALGKEDPETGRVRFVLFGEGWSLIPHVIQTDPKITVIVIPAGDATVASYMARFMRIYMPRTYEDWLDKVDVFMLSDLVPWGFRDDQFLWMKTSIEDIGTGMILSEMGWYGITGWTGNACEDWVKTSLYDAYPCDMVLVKENENCPFIEIVNEGPFLDLPDIETVKFADEQGVHEPRAGTIVWARYRLAKEAAILSRKFGEGMTVANSMGLERFIQPYYEWKYYKDYFVNHVYFAGSVEIPEDLELVHRVREQLETFRDQRSFVIGMIDFIDKFKANTREVELMLAETTPLRKEAEELYIEQKYEESAATLLAASLRFDEINEAAIKLKDQALLWIYIIEWSAVSATSLVTGVIVWALMVRRRLYREVGITRGA